MTVHVTREIARIKNEPERMKAVDELDAMRKAREKDPDKIKAALARICELEPISAEQCPLDHDDVWHGSFASSPLVKSVSSTSDADA